MLCKYHGPGPDGNPQQRQLFESKKKFIQSKTKLLFIGFIESLQGADFIGDQELLDTITQFYKETAVLSYDQFTNLIEKVSICFIIQRLTLLQKKANTSLDRFEKSMRQLHLSSENTQQLPEISTSHFPPLLSLTCNAFDIKQLSVEDVVHEITLQEFKIFAQVNSAEFLSLEWSGPKKRSKAPLLARLIGIFNWVC